MGSTCRSDICLIVGGPAGTTVALALARTGSATVLLVKNGGWWHEPETEPLNSAEIVGRNQSLGVQLAAMVGAHPLLDFGQKLTTASGQQQITRLGSEDLPESRGRHLSASCLPQPGATRPGRRTRGWRDGTEHDRRADPTHGRPLREHRRPMRDATYPHGSERCGPKSISHYQELGTQVASTSHCGLPPRRPRKPDARRHLSRCTTGCCPLFPPCGTVDNPADEGCWVEEPARATTAGQAETLDL